MSETLLKGATPKTDGQVPVQPSEDNHYTVKIPTDKPDMALLPGGIFVMSIPMQAKEVSRPAAQGWAFMGMMRINAIYEDMDRLKREHQARIKKGDLSLLGKMKEGIFGVFEK